MNKLKEWISKNQPSAPKTRTGPKLTGLTTEEARQELMRRTGEYISRQVVKDWSSGRTVVPDWVLEVL